MRVDANLLTLKVHKSKQTIFLNRGFTLIEMLVVIASIGILASIILNSVNYARKKAVDAKIKASFINIRTSANVQYQEANGCYASGGPCTSTLPAAFGVVGDEETADACPTTGNSIFTTPSIREQIESIEASTDMPVYCSSTAGGTAWGIVANLKSDPMRAWCMDSQGTFKEHDAEDSTPEELADEVTSGVCTD